MLRSLLKPLSAVSIVCACLPAHATEPAPQTANAQAPSVAGWAELIAGLSALPGQMLAKLPPEARNDPQIQAELGRLMLSALASSTLAVLNGDGDHPAFVPLFGQTMNLARPNADTIYRTAEITPGGTYRLRGQRGTLAIAKIGETGARGETQYHDINKLRVDGEGRFDVILSPTRPASYDGDWWQLNPATRALMLRMVSSDWKEQRDPTISIERLDRPTARPRPSAAELEQRLRRLPETIPAIAGIRMGWISKLREQGYLNKFDRTNLSGSGLLTGQFYYEAAYELKDDEALIVEVKLPETCGYRSLILTNEMGETIDWTNNHSSLNESQARPDADGVLRIVVSPRDPGIPNWLDTAGYSQGGMQGRWTDCSSQPLPSLRKVALREIRKLLPPSTPTITPAEREKIVRERRAQLQQRPLW